MAKPPELKSSPERKVFHRNRRLELKSLATDGSDQALQALVGEEYKKRDFADRDKALHHVKHRVALRNGQNGDSSSFTEMLDAKPTTEMDGEYDLSSPKDGWRSR